MIMESNFFELQCEVVQASYEKEEVHCSQLAALKVLKRRFAVPEFSYEEYSELWTSIMKNRTQICALDISLAFEDTSCMMKNWGRNLSVLSPLEERKHLRAVVATNQATRNALFPEGFKNRLFKFRIYLSSIFLCFIQEF